MYGLAHNTAEPEEEKSTLFVKSEYKVIRIDIVLPVVLVETVLDRVDRIFCDKFFKILAQHV